MAASTPLRAACLTAILAAIFGLASSAPAQKSSNPASDSSKAPCTTHCPPASTDSKKPTVSEQFPFPGESTQPATSSAPDAPTANPQPKPSVKPSQQFPYPGESDPSTSSSSSAAPSSSNPGSSSNPDANPDATPADGNPDAANPDLPPDPDAPPPPTHSLRRKLPKVQRLQSDEDREAEDLKVARFYRDSGNLNAAYLRSKDAVKSQPDDPDAHFLLAEVAQKLNKRDEAVAEFNTLLTLDASPEQLKAAHKALAHLQ